MKTTIRPSTVRRQVAGPKSLLMISNIGSQAVNFVCGVLMARGMGPAGRGQVSLASTYDEISTNVLSLGVPAAAAYEHNSDAQTTGAIIGAALRLSSITVPFTAVIGWIVATTVFGTYGRGIQLVVLMAIGATPLANTFLITFRMLLVATGRIRALSMVLPVQMGSRLALLGLLWAADALTPGWVAGALVISGWTANVLACALFRVRPRRGGRTLPLLRFGLRTVPASLANMANSRLDQILIAPMLGDVTLGHYAVAIGLTFLPVNVGAALALAGYKTFGARSANARAVRQATLAIGAASVLTALGVVAFAVHVYGDDFRPVVAPALWLVPGAFATGLTAMYTQIGNAQGRPGAASWAQTAGLATTVIGLLLVLPDGGIIGAAIVSSLAATIRLLVGVALVRPGPHRAPPRADAR